MTEAAQAPGDQNPVAPVMCTLTTKQAALQVVEWHELRNHMVRAEPIPQGVVMVFTPELDAVVRDLARREARCCAFLDLDVVMVDGELRLSITSDNPDAGPVIALIASGDGS